MPRRTYCSSKPGKLDPKLADDKTFTNYLALAAAILDPYPEPIDYYLDGLKDESESRRRIKEIEEIRARGIGTDLDNEIKQNAELKIAKNSKVKPATAINLRTGEQTTCDSIKELAFELNLNYKSIISSFRYRKSDQIKYKGYLIKKYDKK